MQQKNIMKILELWKEDENIKMLCANDKNETMTFIMKDYGVFSEFYEGIPAQKNVTTIKILDSYGIAGEIPAPIHKHEGTLVADDFSSKTIRISKKKDSCPNI